VSAPPTNRRIRCSPPARPRPYSPVSFPGSPNCSRN
jgi:hypothetical protein